MRQGKVLMTLKIEGETKTVDGPGIIRTGDEFFKVRVNQGGFVLMVTSVVGCLTMQEGLNDWIERATK